MTSQIWNQKPSADIEPDNLLVSLREGRTDVAPLLVSYYGARLFVYAENAFHYLSDLERETACERAIEKAIRKIERFDPDRGSFDAWLRAFVRFEVADVLRSPHRQTAAPGDFDWFPGPPTVGEQRTHPAAEQLAEALERLSPSDQLIITLRSVELLDYDAIARLIDAKPDACRQRHRRALSRLARELANVSHPSEKPLPNKGQDRE